MQIEVRSLTGDNGSMDLSDDIMNKEFNEPLIHQAVTAVLAGMRQGSRRQKNRSDCRGGGAKPWRQKGTGRARSGTSRSPIWRSGGVTFAARPQDHSVKLNRKMSKGALQSILAELHRQDRLVVVDDLNILEPKTKQFIEVKDKLELKGKILIVCGEANVNTILASRNVPNTSCLLTTELNAVDMVSADVMLIDETSLKALEERLS